LRTVSPISKLQCLFITHCVEMVLGRELKEDDKIEFANKMSGNKTGDVRIT
jgi:hypothetical protein